MPLPSPVEEVVDVSAAAVVISVSVLAAVVLDPSVEIKEAVVESALEVIAVSVGRSEEEGTEELV